MEIGIRRESFDAQLTALTKASDRSS